MAAKTTTAKNATATTAKAKASGQNDVTLSNGVMIPAKAMNKYTELFGIAVERYFNESGVTTAKDAIESAHLPQVVSDTFESITFSLYTGTCELATLHTANVNGVYVGDETALESAKAKVFNDLKALFSFNENMKCYESLPVEIMYICWNIVNNETIDVVAGAEGLDALKVVYNGRLKSTRGIRAFRNRLFPELCWRHMRLEMVSASELTAINDRVKAVRDANTARKKVANTAKDIRNMSALRKKCDTATDSAIVEFLDNEIARLEKEKAKAEKRLDEAMTAIDMNK